MSKMQFKDVSELLNIQACGRKGCCNHPQYAHPPDYARVKVSALVAGISFACTRLQELQLHPFQNVVSHTNPA
jgi:hypothetical protein